MKVNIYKVTDIDWCVDDSDVLEYLEIDTIDQNEIDNMVEAEVTKIINSLPSEMEIAVNSDDVDDIEDYISSCLSNETGWLVNNFSYELIK